MSLETVISVVVVILLIITLLLGLDQGRKLETYAELIMFVRMRLFLLVLLYPTLGLGLYFLDDAPFVGTDTERATLAGIQMAGGLGALFLWRWAKTRPFYAASVALAFVVINAVVSWGSELVQGFRDLFHIGGSQFWVVFLLTYVLITAVVAGYKAQQMIGAGVPAARSETEQVSLSKDPRASKPLLPRWAWIALLAWFGLAALFVLYVSLFGPS